MEVLISIFVGLALMELYAWLDPFAKWLIKQVAKKLPADLQADFIEQFTADLDALPHSVAKVLFAIRDGTLSANGIYDVVYRQKITSVAAQIDSMLEGASYVEASLEEVRLDFSQKWDSPLKFVASVERFQHVMSERQKENDVEAKVAIENFESVTAPIVEYFSTFEATFKQRITAIETRFVSEPYAKVRDTVTKLRERLQDPRPFDPSEEERIEYYIAELTREVNNASKSWVALSLDMPQRPSDLTAQLEAVPDAAAAVSRAINPKCKA